MALTMSAPGGDFSGVARRAVMPIDGIVGFWLPGDSAEKSALNRVAGAVPGVAYGLGIQPNFASVKGLPAPQYIDTRLPETPDLFVAVVARTQEPLTSSTRPLLVGTYGTTGSEPSGALSGFRLTISVPTGAAVLPAARPEISGTFVDEAAASGFARVVTQVACPNVSAWRMLGGSLQSGVGQTVHDLTAGTKAFSADLRPRRIAAGRTVQIGSSYPQAFMYGAADIACVVLMNRVPGQSDQDALTSYIRKVMTAREITGI